LHFDWFTCLYEPQVAQNLACSKGLLAGIFGYFGEIS
jgi:hypothetical protein